MSQNFQFGYHHYLYFGYGDTDPGGPVVLGGLKFNCRPSTSPAPANPLHFNNISWVEYANVTTVNVGGSSTSVDITTRDEARSGFSTSVVVTTQGSMSFDLRYKPRDDAGDVQDTLFEVLLKTWLSKGEIAAVDFDKPEDQLGAQGLVGNWTVNITNKKELQGAVMCTVEMALSSWPNWVRRATVGASGFVVVS